MVGGFIKDEQVAVVHEQLAQCHLLLLATAEGFHLSVEEGVDAHAAEDLLDALFECPGIFGFGALDIVDEVAHQLFGIGFGALREVGETEVVAEGDFA